MNEGASRFSPAGRGAASATINPTMWKRVCVLLVLIVLSIFLFRHAASYLIVHTPEHADVIVVLAGGENDLRYWTGVKLVQEGYAPSLILDVFARGQRFGRKDVDLAKELLDRTTPGNSSICPLSQDSTYDEAGSLEPCLAAAGAKSVLVVTSEYHTRRSREILRHRLPQYHFSFYAAPDPYYFGTRWWTDRQWAKITLSEWERYLWWELVDRWRRGVVVKNQRPPD